MYVRSFRGGRSSKTIIPIIRRKIPPNKRFLIVDGEETERNTARNTQIGSMILPSDSGKFGRQTRDTMFNTTQRLVSDNGVSIDDRETHYTQTRYRAR